MLDIYAIPPRPAAATVVALDLCESIDTGECGTLIVVQGSYGIVPVESVLDGTAVHTELGLSADGRSFNSGEWHTGPEADAVYVERWTPAGRAFHGWVDSASRKLVQAG